MTRISRKRSILKLRRSKRHCMRPSFNWKRRKRWKRSKQGINNSMEEEENDIQANGTPGSISIQNSNRRSTNSGNQDSPEGLSESTSQNNANLDIELLSNSYYNIHPYRPKDPTPNQRQSLKWKKQKRQVARKRQKERKRLERQKMWKIIQQPSDGGNQDSPEGLSQYQPTIASNDFGRSISTGPSFCPNPSEIRNINIETLGNFNEVPLEYFKTGVLYKEQIDTLTQLSPVPLPFKWLSIEDIHSNLEPGPYLIKQHGSIHPMTREVILHCTSLIVFKDCPWEYFDSRGIPLHDIPGTDVRSNPFRFQHPHYNTCGFYAVYFSLVRYMSGSMEEVNQTLPSHPSYSIEFDSLLSNEEYILNYFKKLYNKYMIHKLMIQTTNYLSSRNSS